MTSKFSHQNILQPKRLNSSENLKKIQKGGDGIARSRLNIGNQNPGSGATLTLNGVTIGLPSNLQHLASNCSSSSNTNNINNSSKNNNNNNSSSSINSNNATPAKKGPSIMAKRNARERNRVKQVNQGFQTLRNHIPDGYRLKKMSKVDTLRCALDYIRSMERVLDMTSSSLGDQNQNLSHNESEEHDDSHSRRQYHGYSSEDINQHLDKICSTEETSLDHSFSSFSDNDDGVSSGDNQQLLSPTFHHDHHHHHQQHHHLHQHQEQQQRQLSHSHHNIHSHNSGRKSSTIVSMDENNSDLDMDLSGARLENLVKSNNNSNNNTTSGSILLPLQQHQQQNQPDENFRPTPASFIRVVEIIQL